MSVAARVAWAQLIVMGGGGGAVVEFDGTVDASSIWSMGQRRRVASVDARAGVAGAAMRRRVAHADARPMSAGGSSRKRTWSK